MDGFTVIVLLFFLLFIAALWLILACLRKRTEPIAADHNCGKGSGSNGGDGGGILGDEGLGLGLGGIGLLGGLAAPVKAGGELPGGSAMPAVTTAAVKGHSISVASGLGAPKGWNTQSAQADPSGQAIEAPDQTAETSGQSGQLVETSLFVPPSPSNIRETDVEEQPHLMPLPSPMIPVLPDLVEFKTQIQLPTSSVPILRSSVIAPKRVTTGSATASATAAVTASATSPIKVPKRITDDGDSKSDRSHLSITDHLVVACTKPLRIGVGLFGLDRMNWERPQFEIYLADARTTLPILKTPLWASGVVSDLSKESVELEADLPTLPMDTCLLIVLSQDAHIIHTRIVHLERSCMGSTSSQDPILDESVVTRLTTAVSELVFPPPPGRSDSELLLAHITRGDRLLSETQYLWTGQVRGSLVLPWTALPLIDGSQHGVAPLTLTLFRWRSHTLPIPFFRQTISDR